MRPNQHEGEQTTAPSAAILANRRRTAAERPAECNWAVWRKNAGFRFFAPIHRVRSALGCTMRSHLPRDSRQRAPELREAHRRRLRAFDHALSIRAQRRHGERHGDAVIPETIELAGAKL